MALSPKTTDLLWRAAPVVLSIAALFGVASCAESMKDATWTKEDGVKALTDRKYTNVTGGEVESAGCQGKAILRFGRDYDATDVNGNQVQRRVCFTPFKDYILER